MHTYVHTRECAPRQRHSTSSTSMSLLQVATTIYSHKLKQFYSKTVSLTDVYFVIFRVFKSFRLYCSCVRNGMLHGSETWPVRKENVVALQRAEMRTVRWTCRVKVKDRFPSKELRERLGQRPFNGL